MDARLTKDWIVFAMGDGDGCPPLGFGVGGKNLGTSVVLANVATWNMEKVQNGINATKARQDVSL